MTRCMAKAGYVISYSGEYCMTQAVPRRSAYCYVPKGYLAGIGFDLEMLFQPGPKAPGATQ